MPEYLLLKKCNAINMPGQLISRDKLQAFELLFEDAVGNTYVSWVCCSAIYAEGMVKAISRMVPVNFPPVKPGEEPGEEYTDGQEIRKCRKCGCTEDNACPGPCYWVEPDLCSACVQPFDNDPKKQNPSGLILVKG